MKKRGAPQEQPEPDTSPPAAPVGAPYDPVTVTVRDLADALDDVEDADVVRALQAADPRTSADRYYDARIEELEEAGGG